MFVIAQSHLSPSVPHASDKQAVSKSQLSYSTQSPQIISKSQFDKENLILIMFVVLFLIFKMIQSFLEFISNLIFEEPDGRPHHDSSRLVAAQQVLRFVTLLVTVGVTLTLGLGVFKVFADLASLVLPEKSLVY